MYINDSDDLREAVLKVLKTKAIKPRLKREPYSRRRQYDSVRGNSIIFRIPLEQLPSTEVCLDCGAYISVPCIVVQLCDRILGDIHVEGIFRKNGSQARQHDIKVMLEKGGRITSSHHVIDVAVLLKEFLRCLPVPLIPYNFHDDFLKCLTLSDKCLEFILLLTLALPPSHLNVLAYVMQFLAQISSQSSQNKMNAHNLSVVIAPNVMPSTSRNTFMCANGLARAESCRRIVEDLIINASAIGQIPASVHTHPPSSSVNTPNEDFRDEQAIRRKRRSASLTRMFSGFKRMVAKNNAPDEATTTPGSEPGDNIHSSEQKTPVPPIAVTSPGGKKRKIPQEAQALALGFSAKKRKELMRGFAEHGITLLSPKILIPEGCDSADHLHNPPCPVPVKKKFFSHSASNLKKSTTSLKEKARKSFSGTGLKISRLKLRKSKSKERGLDTTDVNELNAPLAGLEPPTPDSTTPVDYVCVPKVEYEQIEKRLSQIESRISQEFGKTECDVDGGNDRSCDSADLVESRQEPKQRRPSVDSVQTEYAKTLDKVEHLNTTCDNLAERLGRDLRIRRSYDGSRVHRSPSARKIGSLRRRSRERQNRSVVRHHSLNIHDKSPPSYRMERNRSIRRSKQAPSNSGVSSTTKPLLSSPGNEGGPRARITRQTAPRRAQSCLLGASKRSNIPVKQQPAAGWQCAQHFLGKAAPHMMETRRDSIAKLKERNAGMVMAKAKLFDHYADESEGKGSQKGRVSVGGVTNGGAVLRRSMTIENANQTLRSDTRRSLTLGSQSASNQSNAGGARANETAPSNAEPTDHNTAPTRKKLSEAMGGNKENCLSETLENIIYDTCKVRTPDMPIIKKPLIASRSISFRQREAGRTPHGLNPLTPREAGRTSHGLNPLTPRRSPRLVELKSRPLIS